MKLVIQIPCLNEEKTLPATLNDLPKEIEGIDCIEVLVVDDGSTDDTVSVAREHEVDHILSLGTNRGLAAAFSRGVEVALSLGADIVVNTDADNQYCGMDIESLVKPIITNQLDLVVGSRPIANHPEFGHFKKVLQALGSMVLRLVSKTNVRDAASGFRAFSRETCLHLNVHSKFSYCMETLIQAGNSGLRVGSVDIKVNQKTRESRLFKSVPQYVWKSTATMMRMFLLYRPLGFFIMLGSIFYGLASLLGARYLYLTFLIQNPDPDRTYIPSLILLSISAFIGTVLYSFGIIGEMLRPQRKLLERSIYYHRKKML